jgi:hypothetical protein
MRVGRKKTAEKKNKKMLSLSYLLFEVMRAKEKNGDHLARE